MGSISGPRSACLLGLFMSFLSIDDEDSASPGVRKTFWGHLEDLRQAIIRSVIAVCVALVLCLLMSDKLMVVLEYPPWHTGTKRN